MSAKHIPPFSNNRGRAVQWLWGSTFRFFCRVTGKARNRVGLENVGRVEKFERRVVFVFRSLGIVGTREEAVLCCVFVYNRHFRLLSDKWPTEFEGRGSRFPDTGSQPVSARTHALSGAKQQSSSRSAEGGKCLSKGVASGRRSRNLPRSLQPLLNVLFQKGTTRPVVSYIQSDERKEEGSTTTASDFLRSSSADCKNNGTIKYLMDTAALSPQ